MKNITIDSQAHYSLSEWRKKIMLSPSDSPVHKYILKNYSNSIDNFYLNNNNFNYSNSDSNNNNNNNNNINLSDIRNLMTERCRNLSF